MSNQDPQERIEQIAGVARGQKGDTGEQGDPGPGMTTGARHAVIFLFILNLALAVTCLLFTAHEVNASQAAQHAEQQAQRRAGKIVEQRICLTMTRLAALKPPPGNPAQNPSRAFEDKLHATLDQLGPDIRCPRQAESR